MKKYLAIFLSMALLLCLAPAVSAAQEPVYEITLNGQTAALDGEKVPEYDYTWHADPTRDHGQEKNSPAEYHTGTKPKSSHPVYIAHDIVYFPQLPQESFRLVNYAGDPQWAYYYGANGYEDYIFATLPALSTGFPAHMMHTPQEAYQNPVLHITQPGTYRLTGSWQGQIWVDVGKKEGDKVTLILDGADICCTVAPAVVFYNVYGCEDAQGDAGAKIVLSPGSENRISGSNVSRLLKAKYKDEDDLSAEQKKAWKLDGAIYAYQTLQLSGQGALLLESSNEGISSERHITVYDGDITVFSQDDGINANEKDVSVITVLGGNLRILAGLGAEGDGMDANGTIEIYGGNVITAGNPANDVGLDSRNGTYIYGGTVLSMGEIMTSSDSGSMMPTSQPVLKLEFAQNQTAAQTLTLKKGDGEVFSYTPDGTDGRSYPQMILSAPGLQTGESYQLYFGGSQQSLDGKCTGQTDFMLTGYLTRVAAIQLAAHQYGPDGVCALCGCQYAQTKPTEPPATTPNATQPPQTTPAPTTVAEPISPGHTPKKTETAVWVVTVALCVVILAALLAILHRRKPDTNSYEY